MTEQLAFQICTKINPQYAKEFMLRCAISDFNNWSSVDIKIYYLGWLLNNS